MDRRIVWSESFHRSIEEYLICSHGFYSRNTLNSLLDGIKHCEGMLKDNPMMGGIEYSFGTVEFRRLLIKPYFKLIYFISGNDVILSCIWDTRRNPETLRTNLLGNIL